SNSWNTTMRSGPGSLTSVPSRRMVPPTGSIKPATALSSVDLPQPDGPSSTKRSARSTSKLTSWVARTTRCGVRYSRLTCSTCNRVSKALRFRVLAVWPCRGAFMASASLADGGVFEEVVLPGGRLVLDRADAMEELGQRVGVGRGDAELELLVVDDLQQVFAADLRPGDTDIGVGGGTLVVLRERGGLGQRGDEGLVGLGVVLAELLGGIQHGRRVRAEQLVGVEHHVYVRIFQRLVLERRIGEVSVQLGATRFQRGGGIRVWQRQGVLVQAVELVVAPLLGGSVLEEARLHRHAHCRQGDAVLLGEVGDGLDLR